MKNVPLALKKTLLSLVMILVGVSVLAAPIVGQAAEATSTPTGGIVNCESSLPGGISGVSETNSCDLCKLVSMINTIFNYAAVFLGGAAVLMIIVGGIMYMTASGSQELITRGKKTLQFAIIGLVVVILSFVIVQTILGILAPGKNFFGSIDCKLDALTHLRSPDAPRLSLAKNSLATTTTTDQAGQLLII